MSQLPLSRRQLLKVLAAAAGTAVLSTVPDKWKTPVVEASVLPAQPQLSGAGTITGNVIVTLPAGAPVRGDSPLPPPPPIPISILGTAISVNAVFDHTTPPSAFFPYTINNVPAGTYTVRCTYCAANHDVTGVVVNAGATTANVNFSVNECVPCLSGDTLIDTPVGAVQVIDLQVGMPVWTLDATGLRTPTIVAQTIRRPVSSGASIVHLALSDGRRVSVSSQHPTTDGRTIGDLAVGDVLDGSRVVEAQTQAYDQPAKYDLLPAGETGSYWANGIPMNSTIEVREKQIPALA